MRFRFSPHCHVHRAQREFDCKSHALPQMRGRKGHLRSALRKDYSCGWLPIAI